MLRRFNMSQVYEGERKRELERIKTHPSLCADNVQIPSVLERIE
jgi:hypothetical protein